MEPAALPGAVSWVLWRRPGCSRHIPLQSLQFRSQQGAGPGRWSQFALVYGIAEFQGYKNRTCSQDKAKGWWITHLDGVRCDPIAEVERRFYSCLSSKHCSFCTSWASLNISVILRRPVAAAEQEILQQQHLNPLEEMPAPSPAAPHPVKALPTLPCSWDPPHTIPLQPGLYCVCILLLAL